MPKIATFSHFPLVLNQFLTKDRKAGESIRRIESPTEAKEKISRKLSGYKKCNFSF